MIDLTHMVLQGSDLRSDRSVSTGLQFRHTADSSRHDRALYTNIPGALFFLFRNLVRIAYLAALLLDTTLECIAASCTC
jgi:hypothetical protein